MPPGIGYGNDILTQPPKMAPQFGQGGATISPTAASQNPAAMSLSPINPNDNLRGQQINPTRSAATQQARGYGQQALGQVMNAPDRGQIAADTFSLIQQQGQPQFEQNLRTVGQRAASLGRIGAGMTTNELTDVHTQRQRDLDQVRQALSLGAAGQTMGDRLNQLGAATGAEGFFSGQGRADRGELRAERGYQQGASQQAIDNFARQKALENQLLNSQFGRENQLLNTYLSAGYGSTPANAYLGAAGQYDANAAGSAQGLGNLAYMLPYLQSGGGGGLNSGGIQTGVPASMPLPYQPPPTQYG